MSFPNSSVNCINSSIITWSQFISLLAPFSLHSDNSFDLCVSLIQMPSAGSYSDANHTYHVTAGRHTPPPPEPSALSAWSVHQCQQLLCCRSRRPELQPAGSNPSQQPSRSRLCCNPAVSPTCSQAGGQRPRRGFGPSTDALLTLLEVSMCPPLLQHHIFIAHRVTVMTLCLSDLWRFGWNRET